MTIKRYKPVIREAVDDFDEFEAVMAIDGNGQWIKHDDHLSETSQLRQLNERLVATLAERDKRIATILEVARRHDCKWYGTGWGGCEMCQALKEYDTCGGEDGEG